MKIMPATKDEITSSINEWRCISSVADLPGMSMDDDTSVKIEFHKVFSDDRVLAIFDIRFAPQYVKNMNVLFAPGSVDIDFDGLSSDEIMKKFSLLIDILTAIFEHLVDILKIYGKFKIYNSQMDIRELFLSLAEHLQKNYPNKYAITHYSKWIEVQTCTLKQEEL